MSKLREKRDYYDDGSLRAVYFVDKHGKKQGNYTVYEANSTTVCEYRTYVDDVCRYSKKGSEEIFYDAFGRKEKVLHDGVVYQEYRDGDILNGEDMREIINNSPRSLDGELPDAYILENGMFKNGALFEGSRIQKGYHNGGFFEERTSYKSGKKNGPVLYRAVPSSGRNIENVSNAETCYIDGILNGAYHSEGGTHYLTTESACFSVYVPQDTDAIIKARIPDLDFTPSFIKYDGYPTPGVSADGEFSDGIFSGTIRNEQSHGYEEMVIDRGRIILLKEVSFYQLTGATPAKRKDNIIYSCVYDAAKLISLDYTAYGKPECHIKCTYDGDKLTSVDCNGEVIQISYKDGERSAIDIQRYSSRKHEERDGECFVREGNVVIERYTSKNWQKDGLYQRFNRAGRLRIEAQYCNGQYNGAYREFDGDGNVSLTRYYKDGNDITARQVSKKQVSSRLNRIRTLLNTNIIIRDPNKSLEKLGKLVTSIADTGRKILQREFC